MGPAGQDATDQRSLFARVLLAVVAGAALVHFAPSPALAHGPCGCLNPVLTSAGDQVRITGGPGRGQAGGTGWPAYRVVFNADPDDFGTMPSYLSSAYRVDAPTTTVLSRPRRQPTRKGRFRVPSGTPPGLYMVQIFDGSEGGSHSTFDYLHVVDRDEPEQGGVVGQDSAAVGQEPASPPAAQGGAPATAATRREGGEPWPLLGAVALASLGVGIAVGVRRGRRGS